MAYPVTISHHTRRVLIQRCSPRAPGTPRAQSLTSDKTQSSAKNRNSKSVSRAPTSTSSTAPNKCNSSCDFEVVGLGHPSLCITLQFHLLTIASFYWRICCGCHAAEFRLTDIYQSLLRMFGSWAEVYLANNILFLLEDLLWNQCGCSASEISLTNICLSPLLMSSSWTAWDAEFNNHRVYGRTEDFALQKSASNICQSPCGSCKSKF